MSRQSQRAPSGEERHGAPQARRPWRATFILAMLGLSACTDGSQMKGSVTDNFGKPLAGVAVTIDKTVYAAKTDEAGRYSVRFDAGIVNLRFEKDGYIPGHFGIRLNTRKSVRIEVVTLERPPTGEGLWNVGPGDYRGTAPCQLRIETNRQLRKTSILVSGTPPVMGAGGPAATTLNFVDNFAWPTNGQRVAADLYRVMEGGVVLNQEGGGAAQVTTADAMRLDPVPPPSASTGRWFSASLKEGTYVYVGRGVTPGIGLGPDVKSACFTFAIGSPTATPGK